MLDFMIEDNSPSDIWFAATRTTDQGYSKHVDLFASPTDPGAKGTGIYFSPRDPKTLYVNIQHSAAEDGDATWAITRDGKGNGKSKHDRRDHWKLLTIYKGRLRPPFLVADSSTPHC